MARVLILYATVEGHTGRIAERMAGVLRAEGHAAELLRFAEGVELPPCDALLVGASVHYGRHSSALAGFLKGKHKILEKQPSAFFSVSLGAKQSYARKFLRRAGWQPRLTAVFAGALQYSRYASWKRLVVMGFAAIAGHDTDASRDYDYTDWAAVERFARSFAATLPTA